MCVGVCVGACVYVLAYVRACYNTYTNGNDFNPDVTSLYSPFYSRTAEEARQSESWRFL